MQITEPTTMLTDYLLALVALVLAGRLFQLNATNRYRSVQLWNFALIATAVAALLGGTAHGFALHLSDWLKTVIWKGTVWAIGFASFFMVAGTILATLPTGRLRRWLLALVLLKLVLYLAWMLGHDAFKYVIYDYVPAMVLVVLLQIKHYGERRDPAALWLVGGIAVSFVAAGIQLSGLTLHKHFNHNDLYHVVQIGAIYLLYRGIALLEDR